MKHILILLIFIWGVSSCNHQINEEKAPIIKSDSLVVQQDLAQVKDLIRHSFEDIWSNLDSTKIATHHTDDFLLLENGIVWNNDSVKHYLNRERKEMEVYQYKRLNTFDFIQSVHNQTSIWIAYNNYGTWVKGTDTLGSVHWLESVIAVKDRDKWKLQQLHSTTVKN
ncbi:DUF4440 domain-containing protein [Planktosalinus lacus]|uniref:DUF4440 domain-containing protein n=1 Tax=Planktosalinus lacus TaxID=1526573 RepID=A0A8J2VAM7_9FLAO|nr:DUF4440 domain-containing protein [Planktosalinus lacus]GGD93753.1 hypothetical protein GCM10011312_16870 [Planktosalinus lacus]